MGLLPGCRDLSHSHSELVLGSEGDEIIGFMRLAGFGDKLDKKADHEGILDDEGESRGS